MSHIAEVYAKDLGVKIGRPHITEHFIPGIPDKYITIQSSNKMPAAEYKYWDIVLQLVKPYLQQQGIKIIQIGGPKEKEVKGIDLSFLASSYKQMNYIIKSASAHIGCDSLPGHVASVYDIPSVILHFNLYPENSKPLWHKKNKCISISPDFSEIKPSFSSTCDRINEIKPEIIAQALLDQLDIQAKIEFKTIRIGKHFHNNFVEVVPDFFALSKDLINQPVNLRADLHFDIDNIVKWCQSSLINLHTDKVIDLVVLNSLSKLKQVIFKYKDHHDEIDLKDFFNFIENKKVNLIIVCENENNISDVRFKYFDFNILSAAEKHKKIKCQKFFSRKLFISKENVYSSESSANRLDKSQNFVYDEASSKELENLYLYEE